MVEEPFSSTRRRKWLLFCRSAGVLAGPERLRGHGSNWKFAFLRWAGEDARAPTEERSIAAEDATKGYQSLDKECRSR
jgi:hypothetical protein